MKPALCILFFLMFASPIELSARPDSLAQAAKIFSFENAIAISVSPALGEVFVLDMDKATLYKFDNTGKFVRSIGGYGSDRDAFITPTDVSAADGVNVFVADRGNQRIVQYDRWLNYVTSLKTAPAQQSGFSDGEQWRPVGVSLSPQGEFFILEETQRQIIRVNPFNFSNAFSDLSSVLRFGGFSSGRGNLQEPCQIEVSPSGIVFVSDVQQGCIVAYDQFGNYITQIGNGVLNQPKGLSSARLVKTLRTGETEFREYLFVVDRGEVFVFSAEPHRGFVQVGAISAEHIRQRVGTRAEPIDLAVGPDKFYLLSETALYSLPLDLLSFGD